MTPIRILLLKLKNTLRYKHNLILLALLPALAAAGAWAMLAFYLEGGANVPVGVLDYDKSEFSKIAVSRFSKNASVGVRILETGGILPGGSNELYEVNYNSIFMNVYSQSEAEVLKDGAETDGADGKDSAETAEAAGGDGAKTEETAGNDAPKTEETAGNGGSKTEKTAGNGGENVKNTAVLTLPRDEAVIDAAKLVQKSSLEAVIVIMPGFSEKIMSGEPEGLFGVICPPAGVSRGLAAELFAAQASRLYFNCDAANRVVRDAAAAARSARKPKLTEAERRDIFDEAFAYADSYWEPQPLMTVEYERYETSSPAASRVIAGAAGGWQDMREMLNALIARAVFAIFFIYAAFCVVNAAGSTVAERGDGILARLRANGFSAISWIAVSAAAPFILYGAPCAALLAYIAKSRETALAAAAALLCISAAAAIAAYAIKKPGVYRVFTLAGVILSAGVSLYIF